MQSDPLYRFICGCK